MEMAARREPLIQTVGLSGFKAPAHTHCVLLFSPRPHLPPRCPQGDWPPCVMEQGTCCLYAGLTGPCVGLMSPDPRYTTLKTCGSKESPSAKYVSQTFRKQREYCKEHHEIGVVEHFKKKEKSAFKITPQQLMERTDFPRITTSSSSSSPLPLFFLNFEMTRQSTLGVRLIKGLFLGEI